MWLGAHRDQGPAIQQLLLQSGNSVQFDATCNFVDAFLQLEYEPSIYRILRQAMMARRALLPIDSVDEGGVAREHIEEHVVRVLAQQGHIVFATSRPAGINEKRYSGFSRLDHLPLSKAQQKQAIEQRIGAEQASKSLSHLQGTLLWTNDVTSNQLMLSIVIGIFQRCAVAGLPHTVAALYEIGTPTMLERG